MISFCRIAACVLLKILCNSAAATSALIIITVISICVVPALVAKHGDVKTFCQEFGCYIPYLDETQLEGWTHCWKWSKLCISIAVFDLLQLKKEKKKKETLMLTLLCARFQHFTRTKLFFVSPVTKRKTFLIRRGSCTLRITIDRVAAVM